MTFDVIQAIEACYARADAPDAVWLKAVLDSLRALGSTDGYAEIFQFDAEGRRTVECRVKGLAPLENMLTGMDTFCATAPRGEVRAHWGPVPPIDYSLARSARLGGGPYTPSDFERSPYRDAVGIFAGDTDGRTIQLSFGIPKASPPRLPQRTQHQLKHFAAHLTSGARLRHAPHRDQHTTDAVLDPGGRVLDAAGLASTKEAREQLSDAARRIDRARGRLRRARPDEALQLWQGLVDGTWSLVERSESDGKRYIVARRNAPGVRDPKALTLPERSVLAFAAMGYQNKYIAYSLGYSPSAVVTRLRSAQRKLGLASRSELIAWFAGLVERGAA
jgi:DNA-binding CsgD family transcriptional regulator